VKTHVVTVEDDIIDVIRKYAAGLMQPGDIVAVSEKVVAITQGRAYNIAEMKPGFWANFLSRFVRKVRYGIGLRSPFSMQCAIDEVGAPRILLAAIIGGLTRAFGRRGDFYRIAGKQAAMVDAAHTCGVRQYYEYVIKGPENPDQVAQEISAAFGVPAAVVDVNDLTSWVVGASKDLLVKLVEAALKDNPAGQGDACTPVILIREEQRGHDAASCPRQAQKKAQKKAQKTA
jgi:hypothetical protein